MGAGSFGIPAQEAEAADTAGKVGAGAADASPLGDKLDRHVDADGEQYTGIHQEGKKI